MFSGWGNAGRGASSQKEDDMSLTTILNTKAQRVDLALLVCLAADNMRRNLLANFDVSAPLSRASSGADSLLDVDDRKTDERAKIEQNRRRREAELSTPEMQRFQKEALADFDGWRMKVLKRVGEVLSVRSEEVRIARRNASAEADAAATKRREARFYAWAQGEDAAADEPADSELEYTFRVRSIPTNITKLEEPQRVLVLHCMLLLVLSLEHYHAYSRILLQYLQKSFRLSDCVLSEREATVARGLLDSAASQMSAEEAKQKQSDDGVLSRKWKVGLATVGGAVLIGVTGGLAAPILAGAIGGVMGSLGLGALATLLGPLATNFFLIGGLFGAYGGKMTGGIVEKYAKDVEEFQFVPIHGHDQSPEPASHPNDSAIIQAKRTHHLRLTIAISGFLTSAADITQPWNCLDSHTTEPFALQYETDALLRLGTNLATLIQSFAVDTLTWEVLRATLLSSIAAGLMPIGLIRTANMLDSPWAVAKSRSEKAGAVLAQALMDRVQGERPVSLVGYSLGARVLWFALLRLAECGAFGLVESVVFMGAPVPADEGQWRKVRAVVCGRVVNAYSGDDWILGLVYRAGALQWGVAGLQKVRGVEGVENVDLGGAVDGHTSYKDLVGQVLLRIGWEDVNRDVVEREIEEQRMRKQEQKGKQGMAERKKVDVETMVKAQDSGHGIVMVDSTKPLLDIDVDENTTPEWQRPSGAGGQGLMSTSPQPHHSTSSSKPSDLLSSLLDTDIEPTPSLPQRPKAPLTRPLPTHPHPSVFQPKEQKALLSPELERPGSSSSHNNSNHPILTSTPTPRSPPAAGSPNPTPASDPEDYDTESDDGADLQVVAPEPEMDDEPERERVSFGAGASSGARSGPGSGSGFDLMWDNSRGR
ncbi:DUF726-domain-containing protein [Pseudovirgaria hyperparasitica]|uniref:DUF726-domain-containing protein n=1 Tax=Pseudovirgaria hyperparasitica TaxID=470096 RepID=A0A6A6VR90_9PEZI|nr:DUF726-domain-containing protein [Pseudovirgaria hyperparasitica]KAF2753188.1 DUF726-domain-containing protein [Pseudovirgaria hyperparasitica]